MLSIDDSAAVLSCCIEIKTRVLSGILEHFNPIILQLACRVELSKLYKTAGEGFGKVGFGKVGFGKVGFGEVAFGEVGFGEVGFGEVGFGEVGFGEVGFGRSGRTHRACILFGIIMVLFGIFLVPFGVFSVLFCVFSVLFSIFPVLFRWVSFRFFSVLFGVYSYLSIMRVDTGEPVLKLIVELLGSSTRKSDTELIGSRRVHTG